MERLCDKLKGIDELFNQMPELEGRINRNEMYRTAIEKHRGNAGVQGAIYYAEGHELGSSLEQEYEQIQSVNKGFKWVLPRKRDDVQNLRVEKVGEWGDKPTNCYSRGIFFPDNPVTIGVYGLLMGGVIAAGVLGLDLVEEAKKLEVIIGSLAVCGLGGYVLGTSPRADPHHTKKQVTYIQERIDKVYKKS